MTIIILTNFSRLKKQQNLLVKSAIKVVDYWTFLCNAMWSNLEQILFRDTTHKCLKHYYYRTASNCYVIYAWRTIIHQFRYTPIILLSLSFPLFFFLEIGESNFIGSCFFLFRGNNHHHFTAAVIFTNTIE